MDMAPKAKIPDEMRLKIAETDPFATALEYKIILVRAALLMATP